MKKLPVGWEMVKLETIVFKMQSGGTPKSTNKDYYDGNIPFVKIEDITSSKKYLTKTKKNITREGLDNSSAWLVPQDSILYSMYASLGFLAINKIPVATNQAIMNIVPDLNKVNLEYLYQFLLDFKNKIDKFIDQTTQKNLNAQKIKGFLIPLPPLKEQNKIANILSSVDKKIALIDEEIVASELLKKGLMQKLLTEGIGHTEFKDSLVGRIPKSWGILKLSEICKINMGQSPKSETYNEENIGLPLIQGNADIKNRKTLPRIFTSEPTKKCTAGDIIMTVRAPVGVVAKSYHNACIGRGVCSITPKEENDFLYHLLVGHEDKWDKLSQGSTFTAVNGNDIKNIKLPYPPFEEQKEIANILSTADEKLEILKEEKRSFESLKKGLMQKLLSGEIRV